MLALDSRSQIRIIEDEERRRALARISLAHFVRYRYRALSRNILWNWHIDLLCEVLEAVTLRQLKRVIINIPPRHLKSEVASQCWQAWMIGRDDSTKSSLVSASYAAALAHRDSRKTMEILQSEWYSNIFPGVALTKAAMDEWETAGGAARAAAGSGGPITGKGGDHLLGDDLLKPQEANSETIRESINDWTGEIFLSRLNNPKTGTITHVCQRLHERDVVGHLLGQAKNPEADQYYHLCLPLENVTRGSVLYTFGRAKYLRKMGELLHPARIDKPMVAAMKVSMRANFEGQYNQRPQKMEGGMLRPALINRVAKSAEAIANEWGLTPSFYVDLAAKEKETQKDDPDRSAIAVMARDQLQRKWLLDLWYGQVSLDKVAGALIDLWEKWRRIGRTPRYIQGEKIGLQHAFRPILLGVCQVRQRGMLPLIDVPYAQDATMKLEPLAGVVNAGQFYVPGDATWLPDLEAEMRSVPKGAHDDLCTAASYGCRDLNESPAGEAPITHPTGAPVNRTLLDRVENLRRRRAGEPAEDDDED